MPDELLVSALPSCVATAGKAADRLQEVILATEFPEFDEPLSDEDVKAITIQMIKWGGAIGSAYGQLDDSELYPKSLLAVFARRSDMTPSPADLNCAVYVLGEVPSPFHVCFARFAARAINAEAAGLFAGSRGSRPIDPVMGNWPEIKNIIASRRQIAFGQVFGLVAWVRERVTALEEALIPRIIAIRLSGEHLVVNVRQAGRSREAVLPPMLADFLRGLQERGWAELPRSRRSEFLRRVPELAPWLSTHPEKKASGSNAIYVLPPEVRAAIDVNVPARPKQN